MRLLADENVHGELVTWLRTAGHDVAYVAEFAPGAPDDDVLRLAHAERRAPSAEW